MSLGGERLDRGRFGGVREAGLWGNVYGSRDGEMEVGR
jgi:hypothetical protein